MTNKKAKPFNQFNHSNKPNSFNQVKQYSKVSQGVSRLITRRYSTSFYTASLFYPKSIREGIFNIYGFVRVADEIVDTFHDYPQEQMLHQFETDLKFALEHRISTNPILHAFQETVHKYQISYEYIDAFLQSMKMDLNKQNYASKEELDAYIYGSASVVGLMCLSVFCGGNQEQIAHLHEPAKKLGEAFQKVNFLRDLKDDMHLLSRSYFPQIDDNQLHEQLKAEIIADIEADFNHAYQGIKQLPREAKLAVAIAYYYYRTLLEKIKRTPSERLLQKRYRVSNASKYFIMLKTLCLCKANLI